ncbi:hypothetical protein CGLO_12679 [Colletotrichum gloeosporioides Cg-14]|uniref:Uncharacterized protein n=1 Tax=Colletotrichum gloeosporioides (strain Cg-14) TaxID=1237896 RepID=T0L8Z5_COLGC|nr:hypothetical protein CGLO_12679 [Colletotrichum gloeosporioides Cg-14]
MDSTRSNSSSV